MQTLPFPGDVVWIRQQRWRVQRAMRDGDVVRLDVTSRDRALTFLAPFDRVDIDRPSDAPRKVRRQAAVARLANLVARAPDPRLPLTLLDSHVELLPHQLDVALAILGGHCRILLADEVGLGKTIQAGIVINEILRRDPAPRVLVMAPAGLVAQWIDELDARFHLAADRADREGLQALSRVIPYGDNPWRRGRLWIASPDFLKQTHVLASLPHDPWDLVVIDEAHSVCGDSDRYDACAAIARRARRVLLLTATPHAGDDTRYRRLLAIGALRGSPPPVILRRTRASLGIVPRRAVRWHRVQLARAEEEALSCLGAFERAALARSSHDASATLLLLTVFRKRALSTFASLSISVSRRLAWIGEGHDADFELWEPRLPFGDESDDVEDQEQTALRVALPMEPRREALWLQRLKRLADNAARVESKARRVSGLIHRTTEPVVVFSEFRDSLDTVMRHIRLTRSVAWLHGRLDVREQRAQLNRFLRGDASVLLATDVAGQGLNLQSRCRWVVSLEVPWNPAKLEQRLGRVDRISQHRPTHLTVLVARHAAESGLLLHLSRRVMRARSSFENDVLLDAPPDAEIAERLIGDVATTLEPRPAEPIPGSASTGRWRRASSIVAHVLRHRRLFARCWRAPLPSHDCPPLISRDAARDGASPRLVVTTTSILNGLDELAAAVITPIRIASTRTPFATPPGMHSCGLAVATAVRRRVARLQRWARLSAARLDAREAQLVESATDDTLHFEAQPGLFDRRQVDAFEEAQGELASLRSSAQAAIQRRSAAAAFRAGSSTTITALVRRTRRR